jgi:hypothetical protein
MDVPRLQAHRFQQITIRARGARLEKHWGIHIIREY